MYVLRKNTKVIFAILACVDMASEHGDRKIEHESHERCDWQTNVYLEAITCT
jgi:hypothetical protein